MKKHRFSTRFAILAAAFMVLGAGQSFAQGFGGQGGRAGGMQPYNPDAVKTISGPITSVQTVTNPHKGEAGLHLKMGGYTIHACPQWYEDQNQFNFRKGEQITVTGATFHMSGGWSPGDNIYAATITRQALSVPEADLNRIAGETMSALSSSLSAAGASTEEVTKVTAQVEGAVKEAFAPQVLNFRDVNTGSPQWFGRMMKGGKRGGPSPEKMMQMQQEMMKKMRGGPR